MRPSMDHVWVWTLGPAFAAQLDPSMKIVCGVEELAGYFNAGNIMYFDSSDAKALGKLRDFRKVICSVTDEPDKMEGRALELSEISLKFPNVVGGIIDDLSSQFISPSGRYYGLSPEKLGRIRKALRKFNPALKLYGVLYTMNFDLDLTDYMPHIDVVSLWVWQNLRDLKNLDTYLEQSPRIFPDKPILLGLYMFDFPSGALMPMGLLKFEFNKTVQYIEEEKIVGFQILGRYLRSDLGSEQARWIKNFLEENFSA